MRRASSRRCMIRWSVTTMCLATSLFAHYPLSMLSTLLVVQHVISGECAVTQILRENLKFLSLQRCLHPSSWFDSAQWNDSGTTTTSATPRESRQRPRPVNSNQLVNEFEFDSSLLFPSTSSPPHASTQNFSYANYTCTRCRTDRLAQLDQRFNHFDY
mgnify:CR=1 FL=1